jgi:hypothetical protein
MRIIAINLLIKIIITGKQCQNYGAITIIQGDLNIICSYEKKTQAFLCLFLLNEKGSSRNFV